MSEQAHFGLVRKIEVKVDETNDEIFALMVTLKTGKKIPLAAKREALRSVWSYLTQLLYPRAANQLTRRMETVVRKTEGVSPHVAYMLAAYKDTTDPTIIVIGGFTTKGMWTLKLDKEACEDLWTALEDNLKQI